MKRLIFSMAFISIAVYSIAQSDKYIGAMKGGLEKMNTAATAADWNAIAANFERIANAEKNQWLPFYYAGLALSTQGWMDEKLDKDANSLRIKEICKTAASLTSDPINQAEILTLVNMACTQQMMVDPQSRWMSYGQEASKALQDGMKLDPNNPRLYYLMGMSLFNTPQQFGGGKEKAKPIFEKALELYNSAVVKELHPSWGKAETENMIKQCSE
jgi:tetratricopeptide (TPR) repeat protein